MNKHLSISLPTTTPTAIPSQQALETLSSRIKYALKRRGLTKANLAKMVGVKHQVIQYLCDRDVKNSRFLPFIAEALEVDIEWLTLGKGSFQKIEHDNNTLLYDIPLLDEAGIRQLIINKGSTKDIAGQEFIKSTQRPSNEHSSFCFVVHDSSMHPAIPLESFVFIDRDKPLENRSYGLFLINEKDVILRKIKIDGDQTTLIAFNDIVYKNIVLGQDDQLIGIVTEIRWFTHGKTI